MHQLSLRQQSIIDLIQHQEYCTIDALSSQFNVTTQTIRRDINELCSLGLARRHHGGVSLPTTLSNRSFVSRSATNLSEKQRIASAVIEQIPDGCTLFLGIGTTIAAMAEQLGHHQELRVVTNNFQAAHTLSQFEQIEIWMPGGRLRSNDGDVVGDSVSQFFGQFSADIGIVSCAAVCLASNPASEGSALDIQQQEYAMEHELREAIVSQSIISGAQQKWLVANSTKWQRKANARVAPLSYFDKVFGSAEELA
ncbi:DeoR/GlpR family DNA-binding transcription regulator [Vibrio maerlii]|uniref:DeoR/GlpR family DNA-binding transcription regulator n=1 Tax=Vibrio maerlii TaxID=2231648 RepID=UPI000E3CCACF|nr:DeoR/GlpR family DNA-binding transcription regulator [Vibrio maerlii]